MRIIQDLKRDESEIASLRGRSRIIFLIISILILSGIFKIVQLTVFDQSEYVTVSDKNRIINLPLFPSRGLIQLQDGTIIAENIVHQDIFIVGGSIDSSKDQIEFLYVWSEARPEGKAIIIVLVVFSIFAWSVMAAKTMQIRRAKKLNRLFDAEFRQQKKLTDIFKRNIHVDGCPLYTIYDAGNTELSSCQKRHEEKGNTDEGMISLKSMEHGKRAHIGLVKNINLFDPYRRWNPLHRFQARLLDGMFNLCWIKGLMTGRFKAPSALRSKEIPGLKGSSDFIGVNYYTHLLATPFMPTKVDIDPLIRPWEQRTDFRYPMYAEGLRRAFDMVSCLNLPIIVTENGVADDDDDMRPEHIRRLLQITGEAIADGMDIRGFYHWSLMDNFEWAEGYDMKFGLYEVDFKNQNRTLRKGAKTFMKIIHESKK